MTRAARMPKPPVKLFAFWRGFLIRIDGHPDRKAPQLEMSTRSNNQGHGPDSNSSCDQGQPLPPDTYDPDNPDDPNLTPEQTEHKYRFFAKASGLTLLPPPNTAQNYHPAAPQVPLPSLHQPPRPQTPPLPQGQDRKRPGEEPRAPAEKEAKKRMKRPNPDSSSNSNYGLASRSIGMRNYDNPQLSRPSNVQQPSHKGGYCQGHAPQTQPLGCDPDATSTSRGSAHGRVGGKATEIASGTHEDWILTAREAGLNVNISLYGQVQTGGTQYQGRGQINRQYVANDRGVGEDSEPGPSGYPDPYTSAPHHGPAMIGYGGAQSVTRQPFLTNNFSSLSSNSRLNRQGPIHSAVYTSAHSLVSPQRQHQSSQVHGDNDDGNENSALTPFDVVANPNSAAPRSSQLSIYCLTNDPRNNADLQLLGSNPSQFVQTREELLTDLEYLHRLAVRLQPNAGFYATLEVNLPAWNESVRSKYVKRLGRAVAKYGDIPGYKFKTQQQKILKKEAKATVQNSSAANTHGQGLTPPLPTYAPRLPDPFPVIPTISPVPPNLRRGLHISRTQGNTGFQSSPHFPVDPRLLNSPHLPVDPRLLSSPQGTSTTPNTGTQLAVESQNVPNTNNSQARANSLSIQNEHSTHNNNSSTNNSSSAQNTASQQEVDSTQTLSSTAMEAVTKLKENESQLLNPRIFDDTHNCSDELEMGLDLTENLDHEGAPAVRFGKEMSEAGRAEKAQEESKGRIHDSQGFVVRQQAR
jgi:hypothetical protein